MTTQVLTPEELQKVQSLQSKRDQLTIGKEISEKYGEGKINITKGEFTSFN